MNNLWKKFVNELTKSRGAQAVIDDAKDRTHGRVLPPKPALLSFGITEQIQFSKRLAMILHSGMSLMQGLDMLGNQAATKSGKYIIQSLASTVEHGLSLSSGMQKFEKIFGTFCISVVRVGETSGTLHENLQYLAEELKKKTTLRKKVVGAMIYPAVIIVATIGISLVLTVFIFPKITPIFQSFKTALPLSTRILVSLSNFLIKDGLWLFIGVVAFCIAMYFLMRIRTARLLWHRILLKLPLLGKLAQYYNLANTCRTLSLLLRSDVRLISAFQIVAESTRNLAYREALEKIMGQIEKGQRISSELEKYPKFFPTLATQMLSVGEQTGNFSQTLMYLSDMYEEEINDLTKNLTTMIEPVLMIVMGIIVGFIAISIITPIYGITQTISNFH